MPEYLSFFEKWGNKMPSELNENEYTILKNHFKSIHSIKEASPRDCMLYFGLWWKFEYDEGFLSKEKVFESLKITENEKLSNTALEFYKRAKIGGNHVKLKWIQIENTLYLRTLLLNGGIPLINLKNNFGRWKTFLIKVIENKVSNPQEISNNYELIKYLPLSSRNDNIYEIASKISNAIWNNDAEGDKILNILEHNEQGDLVKDLKGHKKNILTQKQPKIKYKAFWELIENANNNIEINLNFDFPNNIKKDTFSNLLNINLENLLNTYNLFCNDHLIFTYKKNLNDDFLKIYTNKKNLHWEANNDLFPIIYFVDNFGIKYFLNDIIRTQPSLILPTLWVQLENNRWMLNQGNIHNGESAFILANTSLNLIDNNDFKIFQNSNYHFFEINDNRVFDLNEAEKIEFKLNTKSKFAWIFNSGLPEWIYSSNKKIVCGFPEIYFKDHEGDSISAQKILIEWRENNGDKWLQERHNFPIGLIRFRFTYEEQIEYAEVYNIDNSKLTINELNTLNKIIYLEHEQLKLFIDQNIDFYENTNEFNITKLTFKDTTKILTRVNGHIGDQSSSVKIKFSLPITRNDLIDKNEKIVENGYVFLINDIYGYRLLINSKVKLKLYNKKLPSLKIEKILDKSEISLSNYNALIQNLFFLNDIMDEENIVVFEFGDKLFNFKLYNLKLKWKDENHKFEIVRDTYIKIQLIDSYNKPINNIDESFKLYSVPLNCALESIVESELFFEDGYYLLKIVDSIKEFVIYSNYNLTEYRVLPTYITTESIIFDTDNSNAKHIIKSERINNFSNSLNSQNFNEDEWSKLLIYIQLCKQFSIPFSTFDNIRAACSSDSLVAKFYLFLVLFSSNNDDFFKTCTKIEDDLGFRFQWFSYDEFEKWFIVAIDLYTNEVELTSFVIERAKIFLEIKFLFYKKRDWQLPDDFHLNAKISNLRSDLGIEVINELPYHPKPYLDDISKNIITQNFDNSKIQDKFKIILRTPVVVALSKLNLYKNLVSPDLDFKNFWHFDNNLMRRNMIYCEEKNTDWYNIALAYSINKLHK